MTLFNLQSFARAVLVKRKEWTELGHLDSGGHRLNPGCAVTSSVAMVGVFTNKIRKIIFHS